MHRVGVGGGHDVGAGGVDLGVDDECGRVQRPIAVDDLAPVVHEHEVPHPDLLEVHPERVDPEVVEQLGVACGDVPGRTLVEAEVPEEAEGRREPLLAVSALVLDAGEHGEHVRGAVRRHDVDRVRPCTARSNRIGAMDFSLTEPERELVGLCRDFAQNEIAPRAPLRRGRRRGARPICSGRWASWACSACSSPSSGAGSACRRSASSRRWSRSAWPTSRWPRRGRPT